MAASQDEGIVMEMDTLTSEKYLLSYPPGSHLFRCDPHPHRLQLSYVSLEGEIIHLELSPSEKSEVLHQCKLKPVRSIHGAYVALCRALKANEIISLTFYLDKNHMHGEYKEDLEIEYMPLPASILNLLATSTSDNLSLLSRLPREILLLLQCFCERTQPSEVTFFADLTPQEALHLGRMFGDRLESLKIANQVLYHLSHISPEPEGCAFLQEIAGLSRLHTLSLDLCDDYIETLTTLFKETRAPLKKLSLLFTSVRNKQPNSELMAAIAGNSSISLSSFSIQLPGRSMTWPVKPILQKGLQELRGVSIAFPFTEICEGLAMNCPLRRLQISHFDKTSNMSPLVEALRQNTNLTELFLARFRYTGDILAEILSSNRTLKVLSAHVVQPGLPGFVEALKTSSLQIFIAPTKECQKELMSASNNTITFDKEGCYMPKN